MPKDTAGALTWNIGKLIQAIDEDKSTSLRIEIPKFQRSLVWNDSQRANLIESIHRGYPIGSILLFKKPTQGPYEVYQVVDGLQRTNTLRKYVQTPLLYTPSSLFPTAAIQRISDALGSPVQEISERVQTWMKTERKLSYKSPKSLLEKVLEGHTVPSGVRDIVEEAVSEALDDLQGQIDISAVSLPVVTYTGDAAELPTIFERINQSGTKLSKYEVFAATWIHDNAATQINDEEIRSHISQKYKNLIDSGFDVDGIGQDDAPIQDFNLFEYLFGFGKLLVSQNPLLFADKGSDTETEPAGFSLFCVALGHQLSEMGKLPSFMPLSSDGMIDPSDIQKKLLEAAAMVQEWLRPFIGLKLNSNSIDFSHGELQIVSMIARTAIGRWDPANDWRERPNWKADWASLKIYMPQHYLTDIVSQIWRGPIYSTLYSRVWSAETRQPSKVYSTSVTQDNWDYALNGWFDRQLAREQRDRSYVRDVERTFLRFLYAGIVTHKDNYQVTYELEHLYPVSRLKMQIKAAGSDGWPISCVANLALFPHSLNREKSALTISEYFAKYPQNDHGDIDKYLLCDVGEVFIPEEGLSEEEYINFLKKRWARMKLDLAKSLKVSDG